MSELFNGENDIRNLFKRMLGSKVIIKDNLKSTEESVFCLFVELLETTKQKEDKLLEAGLDIHELVDSLWVVVENLMKMEYGTDTTEAMMWYLYDRIGPDGEIIEMIDENTKKSFKFDNPKDLFKFLKYRSSNK
jgi:hypothetical protein